MVSAHIQYFVPDNSLSRAILTNLQQVTLATFSMEGKWLTRSMTFDLELGFFAPIRSCRSMGGLLRRKRCVCCPRLPPSPLFHACVRVHCTLCPGKRIRLLLSTRRLTHNCAQERRANTCTGRQHRRPPRRGNETALRCRIACYSKSIANSDALLVGRCGGARSRERRRISHPPLQLRSCRVPWSPPPPPPFPLAIPRPSVPPPQPPHNTTGEAPYTNRGTCHVGEAPPTNRGIRHVNMP